MEEILRVENISKHYRIGKKTIHALDDINLHINSKEIMGIVGESGSGKSTLGKCMIQLEEPDDGNIYFEGTNMKNVGRKQGKEIHKKMQMVFQNPYSSFNPKIKIGDVFFRLSKYYGYSLKEGEEKVLKLLEMVNMADDVMNRMPGELSGGQLQRLALVRAMYSDPTFIIADEAVSALDISIQAQVLNLFMEMTEKMDLSILFISHDLNVVRQICDRVAVLYLGQIIEMGTVEEIYNSTGHPYTKSLILSKPKEHPKDEAIENPFLKNKLNAVDVGEGCRFYGRCPYAIKGTCNKSTPKLQNISGTHLVACHKIQEEK